MSPSASVDMMVGLLSTKRSTAASVAPIVIDGVEAAVGAVAASSSSFGGLVEQQLGSEELVLGAVRAVRVGGVATAGEAAVAVAELVACSGVAPVPSQ